MHLFVSRFVFVFLLSAGSSGGSGFPVCLPGRGFWYRIHRLISVLDAMNRSTAARGILMSL
jgi:hypothetical protein